MGEPSTAAYFSLRAEHDELKCRCEALLLESQCIPGFVEEAKELRAKVADVEKSTALTKRTPTRRQNKKRLTVVEERIIALDA